MKSCSRKKKSAIDVFNLVDDYISGTDWRVNEDSNKGYSLAGLSDHLSTTIQARYWLDNVYFDELRDAHISGALKVHDLGYLSSYCCGWDLKDLLIKGLTGVPGRLSCSPPKHLDSALDQIFRFMFLVRQEAAGAQAISSLDTYLAPFIYYDGLNYKEVKQRLQKFLYNMNLPLDKGFQVPFTNVTLDVTPTGSVAEEAVVIGGELQNYKYKDFQKEMFMFNKAFAEVMVEGDTSGRVFSWPIPTYNITKDFPWDHQDLDGIWEMTAKFGIPYFSNFVNSDMKPDDVRSMCCRLRIDNRELRKRGGGLFGSNPLTGSIGVVTINMPRIGYLSKNKEDYFERLGSLMDLAKRSLMIKRKVVEELTERGLYPYTRFYLQSIKDRFGQYWKNHFNTIGLNGLNESMINFFRDGHKEDGSSTAKKIDYKQIDLSSDKGRTFGLEVLDFMRKKLLEYQEETDEIFNLEATPAESTTYYFAKNDKERYPDIITATDLMLDNMTDSNGVDEFNVDDEDNDIAPYYTNSSQLVVDSTEDVFEALDLQDKLQCKYTGGTVFHVFLGERMPTKESTKSLVKKISNSYKLPYFSITPTFSICPKHGYLAGEHEFCPKCDETAVLDVEKTNVESDDENVEKSEVAEVSNDTKSKRSKSDSRSTSKIGQGNNMGHQASGRQRCEVYSRVVGFLSPVNRWNKGKKSEWKHRTEFNV